MGYDILIKIKQFFNWLIHGDLLQPFRRVRAWYHDGHQVYRDFLTYDAERGRYVMNRETVTQLDVKPDDLGVTGDKWHYFQTNVDMPPHEETRIEERDGVKYVFHNLSAIALDHYGMSDDLINSQTGEFKDKLINPLVLAILIVAGIGLLVFFIMGR